MSDFRSFSGLDRQATWLERELDQQMKAASVLDVLLTAQQAPKAFWNSVMLLTDRDLAGQHDYVWSKWDEELCWVAGLYSLGSSRGYGAYQRALIRDEITNPLGKDSLKVDASFKLTCVEVLLDCCSRTLFVSDEEDEDEPVRTPDEIASFEHSVNELAKRYRVGLRVENRRFAPLLGEHIHNEIVRPTLLLLNDTRFEEVDKLYRKAFNRALDKDFPGSITATITCLEEMFRSGLGLSGPNLKALNQQARNQNLISVTAHVFIEKIWTLRPQSDGHAGGVAAYEDAMFAIHLVSSILMRLEKTATDHLEKTGELVEPEVNDDIA